MSVDSSDLRREVDRYAGRIVRATASQLGDDLDQVVPSGRSDYLGRPRRGPRLRDSRRINVSGKKATIRYTANHASFTDEGTAPHRIFGNPLLVFYWPKVGKIMYLPRVNHPGTAPQRWWTRTMAPKHVLSVMQSVARGVV